MRTGSGYNFKTTSAIIMGANNLNLYTQLMKLGDIERMNEVLGIVCVFSCVSCIYISYKT